MASVFFYELVRAANEYGLTNVPVDMFTADVLLEGLDGVKFVGVSKAFSSGNQLLPDQLPPSVLSAVSEHGVGVEQAILFQSQLRSPWPKVTASSSKSLTGAVVWSKSASVPLRSVAFSNMSERMWSHQLFAVSRNIEALEGDREAVKSILRVSGCPNVLDLAVRYPQLRDWLVDDFELWRDSTNGRYGVPSAEGWAGATLDDVLLARYAVAASVLTRRHVDASHWYGTAMWLAARGRQDVLLDALEWAHAATGSFESVETVAILVALSDVELSASQRRMVASMVPAGVASMVDATIPFNLMSQSDSSAVTQQLWAGISAGVSFDDLYTHLAFEDDWQVADVVEPFEDNGRYGRRADNSLISESAFVGVLVRENDPKLLASVVAGVFGASPKYHYHNRTYDL